MNKNLIVLDIGTQFIKAVLLEITQEDKRGIIRFWTKEPIVKSINEACQKAVKNLEKKSGLKSQEFFLGTNSDILKGKTTTVCYKRENPNQKIDISELKYLIQKIQWRALDAIRKELAAETEFCETDAKLIDGSIVDIKVDGHPISDPIGFQGQNICLTVFNSYTSLPWLNNLNKLANDLKLKMVGLCPVAYALFHCLDLEKSSKGSVLIIDVGAKITEITLVKNGGEIIETKNFHLGGQAFSRILAEFLGLKLNEADTLKIKYCKKELSSEAKKKIEKLFVSNISSWLKGIKVVLDGFADKYKFIPPKIFLCGEGSKLPMIESGLKKEKEFKINYIFPRDILKIENKTKLEEMPVMALAELYLDLPAEESIFPPILRRVIKLIQ